MARKLALDVGEKRIGVALSDPTALLASPLTIISMDKNPLGTIAEIVKHHQVDQIIVGLPRSLNGSLGPQARLVQEFADKLKEAVDLPVVFRDERFTTVTAERLRRTSGSGKGEPPDAVAAAIILQDYLDRDKPFPAISDTGMG